VVGYRPASMGSEPEAPQGRDGSGSRLAVARKARRVRARVHGSCTCRFSCSPILPEPLSGLRVSVVAARCGVPAGTSGCSRKS